MLVLQSDEVETSLARPSTEVCIHLGVECFYDSIGQRAEISAREAPEWLVTRVSVQPWTKDNNLLRKFKFSGTLPAPNTHNDLPWLTSVMGQPTPRVFQNSWAADVGRRWRFLLHGSADVG